VEGLVVGEVFETCPPSRLGEQGTLVEVEHPRPELARDPARPALKTAVHARRGHRIRRSTPSSTGRPVHHRIDTDMRSHGAPSCRSVPRRVPASPPDCGIDNHWAADSDR